MVWRWSWTRPRSLALRLVAGAALWSAIALVATGILLATLFRDVAQRNFDNRLNVLLEGLIAVTEVSNGQIQLTNAPGEPRFNQPYSGWYWEIDDADGVVLRSRSLFDIDLGVVPPSATTLLLPTVAWGRQIGTQDEKLRLAVRDVLLPGRDRPLRFTVAGDEAELRAEIATFANTVIIALATLGVGLVLAVLLQVRYGLGPLRRMRQALAAIRAGTADRLEGDFPIEVRPLIGDLNALLQHNAEVLNRARTHVGNLAHALKTPLAILANAVSNGSDQEKRSDLPQTVAEQTEVMRRWVDHHLARARSAGAGQVLGQHTDVMVALDALVRTLERVHAERQVILSLDGDDRLLFKGERHDLEEMAGNLIDNACKWARRRVDVSAVRKGDRILIIIDDDGPGLSEGQRTKLFKRGMRLDEAVPGSGLGLAIVRDVTGLYGGKVSLEESPRGGLRATIDLPAME
ncbi:MAG: sensor histidine kinase [Alphaproteobacteria bacterium]